MTLEELEIIIKAKIEDVKPQITKMLKDVKNAVNSSKGEIQSAVNATSKVMQAVNTQGFITKITKAVQVVKDRINNLKKTTQNSQIEIKVNNEKASQEITQLEKEIDSLQKKISGRQLKLNITNDTLDKMRAETNQAVINEMPDAGNKRIKAETYSRLDNNSEYATLVNQSDKLSKEVEKYNSLLNTAKSKMSELKQETQNTGTSQNKLTSFFSTFKDKLQGAISNAGGLKRAFNQIPKITQKVTNHIKNMGTGLRGGLKNVLKYAMALFSLRGIYSVLSNSASTWLSSQNSAAKQLNANIEYMKYAMGSALAPVIQFIVNLVYKLMKAIQSVVYALTGVNIFAKASAKSYNAMANSAKKAKKETQSLADIDEIHNIQENNSNADTGTTTPNMDLSKLGDMSGGILDALKKGDWGNVGSIIAQKLNEALEKIPWDGIQNGARKIAKNIADFLNGFIATTDWSLIGKTLAQGLNTAIYFLYTFVTTFKWAQLGTAIGKSINGFVKNIDWATAGRTLGEGIKGIFNSISAFLQEVDWAEIVRSVETFLTNIDWNGIAISVFTAIGAAFGAVASFLGQIIVDIWTQIKEYFKYWIDEAHKVGGNILEGILVGILNAIMGIGEWIYNNIFLPFINGFKNAFGIHSPSTVMAEMGTYIIEGFKNGIQNIWEKVKGIFEQILTSISKIVTSIVNRVVSAFNTLKSKISGIMTGIKNVIKGIWNGIWGAIKKVINSILSGIERMANGIVRGMNRVIDVLNNLKVHIPDWIPLFGGKDIGFRINKMSQISIPKLATGTNYIPKEGLYHLHEGEAVVPKRYNPSADNNSSTSNNSVADIKITNELKIGNKTLVREIIPDLNSELRRLGYQGLYVRG